MLFLFVVEDALTLFRGVEKETLLVQAVLAGHKDVLRLSDLDHVVVIGLVIDIGDAHGHRHQLSETLEGIALHGVGEEFDVVPGDGFEILRNCRNIRSGQKIVAIDGREVYLVGGFLGLVAVRLLVLRGKTTIRLTGLFVRLLTNKG